MVGIESFIMILTLRNYVWLVGLLIRIWFIILNVSMKVSFPFLAKLKKGHLIWTWPGRKKEKSLDILKKNVTFYIIL